ncbi:MAG: hydroxypyruvate isomerase [Methylomonas sp.]|nr:MAG: hydroxypyruvate isomerase [Methylobacter sp.]PPD32443.1 MAG: hydroxypyruvate isomerase [Methylomonas sp.]
MLKFSANLSLLFTELELPQRFQAARQAGFSAVEMQFPYSLSAQQIRQELDRLELQLVLFNIAADDLLQGGEGLACVPEKHAQFRQSVDQAMAYADILKPQAVNVLPGRCLNPENLADYWGTFITNLQYAADGMQTLGVKTVFEAINTLDMPGFIISTGDQMLEVLEQLNHPNLFMQYDIYHQHRMQQNMTDFITRHWARIGHIQFADCPGRGQPGTGAIDFPQIFATIEKTGYPGWIGAEYKPVANLTDNFDWLKIQY